MKNFNYYSIVEVPYTRISEFKKLKLKEINEQKMTAAERDLAISELENLCAKKIKENTEEYKKERDKKKNEFWKDCREYLGYDKILTYNGCHILEKFAWSLGHSNGFEEVFNCLSDLDDLIVRIKDEFQ